MISLRELAEKQSIFIGAAVNVSHLENDNEYKEILQREFNRLLQKMP